MIQKSPYEIAEGWVKNHGCTDTVNRYLIKYEETSKNVYKVTCKRCGATTVIENK